MASSSKLIRVVKSSLIVSRSVLGSMSNIHRQPSVHRCLMSTKTTDQPREEGASTDKDAADIQKDQAASIEKENQLQAEIKKLGEDLKEHKEKYMRSLAEAENMRKRLTKQTEDAKIFGISSFCKDLLEVSDVLNTAINAVPKEELTDSNPHLKNLFEGLNMTESQLLKVFNKHGLFTIYPKEGEKFDPHIHEALFQVPVQVKETQEPDTVAVVQKIGYKLHERTLRPALVGVFKGS